MANNSKSKTDTIDKKDLCNVVTPELITDLVSAIWYAEDNGWSEKEDVEKLQTKIDKIASFCDIYNYEHGPPKKYLRRT